MRAKIVRVKGGSFRKGESVWVDRIFLHVPQAKLLISLDGGFGAFLKAKHQNMPLSQTVGYKVLARLEVTPEEVSDAEEFVTAHLRLGHHRRLVKVLAETRKEWEEKKQKAQSTRRKSPKP